MTTWGLDISHYQAGLNLSRARDQGFSFCMAKVSEGNSYLDPSYATFRDAAKNEKLLFAAYHFLTDKSDPAEQGRYAVAHLGDKSIPIMADVESEGSSSPHIDRVKAFVNAVHSAGGRVSLLYLPHWYWGNIGSPSLSGLPALVASNYVSGSGYASALYPGDGSSKWGGYGGVNPTILQFSSTAIYTTYGGRIDVNAYRGTEAQLKSLNLFKDYSGGSTLKVHDYKKLDGLQIATIRYGDNDKDYEGYHMVWRLQKELEITADGDYGPKTAAAVKSYLGHGDGKTVGIAEWTTILGLH